MLRTHMGCFCGGTYPYGVFEGDALHKMVDLAVVLHLARCHGFQRGQVQTGVAGGVWHRDAVVTVVLRQIRPETRNILTCLSMNLMNFYILDSLVYVLLLYNMLRNDSLLKVEI